MDVLEDHMVTSPLPCVYLVTTSESQAEFSKIITDSGKARTINGSERIHIKVIHYDDLKVAKDIHKDWLYLERYEPTCIMFCRDWNNYEIDNNLNSNVNPVLDSSVVNVLPSRDLEQDEEKESKTIKGTLKQLETLVREDVENCISKYRDFMVNTTNKCKILFLILLDENVKDPNKVVSGLKTLNPNEVAAVCVTCGFNDISTKLAKVEQIMYEISLSYYEKKIKRISKATSSLKYHVQSKNDHFDVLKLAALYFKLGYFSEFLSNTKDSANKYNHAWNLIKQMKFDTYTADKIALALFTSLRIINGYFSSNNIMNALTFSLEVINFIDIIYNTHIDLYYKFAYNICFNVADKLEYLGKNDSKNQITLIQQASHYFKWAIKFIIYYRELYKYTNVKNFGNILFYEDEDFKRYYVGYVKRVEDEVLIGNKDATEPLIKVTTESSCNEEGNTTSEIANIEESPIIDSTQSPLSNESNDDCFEEASESSIKITELKMMDITHSMIKRLLNCLSRYSWNNSMVECYVLLGDSYYISRDYKHALHIYIAICNSIVYSVQLEIVDEDVEIDQLRFINICLFGEMKNNKNWLYIFRRLLSRIIILLCNIMNNLPKPPKIIYDCADLTFELKNDVDESDSLFPSSYKMILIKGLLTLISLLSYEELFYEYILSLSLLPCMSNLKSFIILNKNHTSQYITSCYNKKDDELNMYVDILLNFNLDLPFDIEVCEGFINTSIGISSFYTRNCTYDDKNYVMYTTNEEALAKTVKIPKDVNILLLLTLTSNFKFTSKHFRVISVCLKWQLNNITVYCILPSLMLYHYESKYSIEGKIVLTENVLSLGFISSSTIEDDMMYNYDKRLEFDDRIMLLMYKALEMTLDEYNLTNDNIKLFKIINNLNVKVYTDDIICNVLTPIIFVITCNDELLAQFYSDFDVIIDVINSNNDLYILSYEKQLINCNKIIFNFEESILYNDNIKLDIKLSTDDTNTTTPLLYKFDEIPSWYNELLRDVSEDYNSVYLIFGLLKVYKPGINDDKFNIYCKLKENTRNMIHNVEDVRPSSFEITPSSSDYHHTHSLDGIRPSSYSVDKMLVSTKFIESYAHEQMSVYLSIEDVYNNTIGNKFQFLSIKCYNNTPIKYKITEANIFNDNNVIADEKSLLGFVTSMGGYEHVNFMYKLQPNTKKIIGMCSVKFVQSIDKAFTYPFNYMTDFIKSIVNGYIDVVDESGDIYIDIKHDSIVKLNEEFEFNVTLYNNTEHKQECNVCLDKVDGLVLSEPNSLDVLMMPKSSDMLRWTIKSERCGYCDIPRVNVAKKNNLHPSDAIIRSHPTRVCVTDR